MSTDELIIRQVAFKGAIESLLRSPAEFKTFEELAVFVEAATDRFEDIIWKERVHPEGGEKPNRTGAGTIGSQDRPFIDKPKAAGQKHYCELCGKEKTYRAGTSKAGKAYRGLFCPDRDCKGKPTWLKDEPEGLEEDSGEIPFE